MQLKYNYLEDGHTLLMQAEWFVESVIPDDFVSVCSDQVRGVTIQYVVTKDEYTSCEDGLDLTENICNDKGQWRQG